MPHHLCGIFLQHVFQDGKVTAILCKIPFQNLYALKADFRNAFQDLFVISHGQVPDILYTCHAGAVPYKGPKTVRHITNSHLFILLIRFPVFAQIFFPAHHISFFEKCQYGFLHNIYSRFLCIFPY